MRVSIDKAGRLVVPKEMRTRLRLRAGDELEIEAAGEEIVLRPVQEAAEFRRERGLWTFRGAAGPEVDAVEWHLRAREERIRSHSE